MNITAVHAQLVVLAAVHQLIKIKSNQMIAFIKILLLGFLSHTQTSIYSLTIPAIDGSTIDFSNFQNKKILIVNTADSSDSVQQFAELEQLYEQYQDSLIIIACPSSSFTQDTYSNEDISAFVAAHYNVQYLIAAKQPVTGMDTSPLYQWLTTKDQNGAIDMPVSNDFQKYLIDGSGNIIGVFDKTVSPLSDNIQNAIQGN